MAIYLGDRSVYRRGSNSKFLYEVIGVACVLKMSEIVIAGDVCYYW
jgi:hypothetical protein